MYRNSTHGTSFIQKIKSYFNNTHKKNNQIRYTYKNQEEIISHQLQMKLNQIEKELSSIQKLISHTNEQLNELLSLFYTLPQHKKDDPNIRNKTNKLVKKLENQIQSYNNYKFDQDILKTYISELHQNKQYSYRSESTLTRLNHLHKELRKMITQRPKMEKMAQDSVTNLNKTIDEFNSLPAPLNLIQSYRDIAQNEVNKSLQKLQEYEEFDMKYQRLINEITSLEKYAEIQSTPSFQRALAEQQQRALAEQQLHEAIVPGDSLSEEDLEEWLDNYIGEPDIEL